MYILALFGRIIVIIYLLPTKNFTKVIAKKGIIKKQKKERKNRNATKERNSFACISGR